MQDTNAREVKLEANCVVAFMRSTKKMRLHRFKEGGHEEVQHIAIPDKITDKDTFEEYLAELVANSKLSFVHISTDCSCFMYRIRQTA